MDAKLTCPKCQRKLRVSAAQAGRPILCPACGTVTRMSAGRDDDAPLDVEPAGPRDRAAGRADAAVRSVPSAARRAVLVDGDDDDALDDEVERRPRRNFMKPGLRPAPAVLRILAIIFVIIAALPGAVYGTIGAINRTEDINRADANPVLTDLSRYELYQKGTQADKEMADRMDYSNLLRERFGFLLLIGGLAVAIVACVFIEFSRGWMAGILLLLVPIGPAFILPITLVFTCLFVPIAILSFFVWRRNPLPAPGPSCVGSMPTMGA
jgi:hypothetical protein